jgi:type II secretory pathway predicted ATPase ExeA
MTPELRESLACLQYGIAARKGFVVLTGPVGSGKTTLLKSVLSTFSKERIASSFVFNPSLEVLDFLEFVLSDFGIPPTTRTKSGMLIQLNRWLIERYNNDGLCVIVVDEAQNLSRQTLEEIRLLTNLETTSEKLVQIVLSGQTELEDMLHDHSMRQLRQRISFWCRTHPLTADQTNEYVTDRLRTAGASQPVLSPEAIELVHLYSRGIPRVINLLCEHALLVSYADGTKPVTAHVVESVGFELGLHPSSPIGEFGLSEECMPSVTSNSVKRMGEVASTLKGQEI